MKKRAAVGMSGGTDSSVAAALLVEQGYEVIGLTAHMWKDGSRCCSLEDVARAQKVCAALGIRHYVVNAQDLNEAGLWSIQAQITYGTQVLLTSWGTFTAGTNIPGGGNF